MLLRFVLALFVAALAVNAMAVDTAARGKVKRRDIPLAAGNSGRGRNAERIKR